MFDYINYKVYLVCGFTDCRKNVKGLSDIVQTKLKLNTRDKIIFVFCNRSRNRVKLLVWEENGFWIHFKRIERGSIFWPDVENDENIMPFNIDEFLSLMKAPNLKQKTKRKEV